MIGREKERGILTACRDSGQAEFVVLYGRRRIGKTYLVREFFENQFAFSYVGGHHLTTSEQLANFAEALREHARLLIAPRLTNWTEAFRSLKELLKGLPEEQRKVVFFDEMPWIDSPGSDFIKALETFWNGWAALRDDIFFIACGSATSWMAGKLMANQGGLHNRITQQIYLRPFNLRETELMLESIGCHWDRFQVVQCYMAMGGVPYYLGKLSPRQSLSQNIDRLYFEKNAPMRSEFDELYYALFANADRYISVVKTLATSHQGLTRTQLAQATGMTGGWLTRVLVNLERCDFIISYAQYGNKAKNIIYRLADFYTLFYMRFVENDLTRDEQQWTHLLASPRIASWQGRTFELICLTHLQQIKQGLGISGMLTSASSWRGRSEEVSEGKQQATQVDLLIERADRIINLCEIKFTTEPFEITRDYEQRLRMRMAIFKSETKTRKSVVNTFITTYGVIPGKHSAIVQSELTMEDLFL